MTGLVVHHLNCGHFAGMALGGRPLSCHVLLIETPDSGLVLVDSGLGATDLASPRRRLGTLFALYTRPVRDVELAAVRQVRALGFDPKDVRHIVMTHLDLDHVGGLSDFPWAAVHVHTPELVAALIRRGGNSRGRYKPAMWNHAPHFITTDTVGEAWFGFEAVRDLAGLPPEILLVPLSGHSLGHVGVAVQVPGRWLLAAGDAYFDPREVHGPVRECARQLERFQRFVTADRELWRHNQVRLRQLIATQENVTVFSAHDPWAPGLGDATTISTAAVSPGE